MDGKLPAAGGSGGVGGRGSNAGGSAGGSTGGTGVGGSATGGSSAGGSAAVADAGTLGDAGSLDASMAAAGSGGAGASGGAGGAGAAAGSGGAGGSTVALPFEKCVPGGGVEFCNSFEEQRPWVPPWGYENLTDGIAERNTARVYWGTASAHYSTTNNTRATAARISFKKLNDLKSGDLWLRYYYWVPGTVVINNYFSAGVMSELVQPYYGFSLLIYADAVQIESALNGSQKVSYAFPRDRWVCVEHHAFIDSTNGYFEIFVDNALKVQTPNGNTVPASGFTSAEVGIHYVGNNEGPVDVYVDNVVVSTVRYGCD